MKKSNLKKDDFVLIDFDLNLYSTSFFDGLADSLKNSKIQIIEKINNESVKNIFHKIKQVLTWFFTPLSFWIRNRKKARFVFCWQQFYGLFLLFILHFFRSKSSTKIIVLNFIYIPKKGFFGKLYKKFVYFAISDKHLHRVFCNSSKEIEEYSKHFSLPLSLFKFERFSLTRKIPDDIVSEKGDYFLSAGRSNRDYNFLIDVFRKMPEEKLYIVCDNLNEKNIPPNVKVFPNTFLNEYYQLLAKCFAVIISLADAQASSGQLVLQDASMFSKPIIVTENNGIKDYLNSNCIVISKEEGAVLTAINSLKNAETYRSFSQKNASKLDYQFGVSVGEDAII